LSCIGLKDDTLSFLIGGEAGQGITRSGSLLGKALMRAGFHVFGMNDYPSIIRGGHNFYLLRVSDREVHSPSDTADVMLALNKETILIHEHSMSEGAGVVYDEKIEFDEGEIERDDIIFFPVPLTEIVKEIGGTPIMTNTVALGAAAALVDFDPETIKKVIADTFSGREEIIEQNAQAIEMGFEYVKQNYDGFPCSMSPLDEKAEKIMLTGNEAVALGAIQAGCRFYSAYPMTPASGVLHYLAGKDVETGMVVVQAESEIAAMNMVVGASYGGARSMTATSGGGFCLMTEAFGLAGATETPVVVMLGQRPGPSTGMATYTAQADLLFAVHTSQGEFPRVVVAPGDVEGCFYRTMEAFNLAEKYQVPVIILTDKFIIESQKSEEPFDQKRVPIERGALLVTDEWTSEDWYKRYKITESGVSPRILLGTKGATFLANGNEHDEYGYTTIDPEKVVAMAEKRFRKQRPLVEELSGLEPVEVFGDPDAVVTLVGWGSTKGPALEALRMLGGRGVKARFVQVVYMEPFPAEELRGLLKGGGEFILFETNMTAQLGKLIRLNTGFAFEHVALKYDGRPFNPGEICARVEEVI
jgi:2-oxoglutarate ferredoxin oxidoreductase subunit alpha